MRGPGTSSSPSLLNALNPTGPFMCLLIDGEQGSGKSFLSDRAQAHRRPECGGEAAVAEDRARPDDPGVGEQAAGVRQRLGRQGGHLRRAVLTRDRWWVLDETLLHRQPVAHLHPVPPFHHQRHRRLREPSGPPRESHLPRAFRPCRRKVRKEEREINAAFDQMLPSLLGMLFDLVAAGLANLDTTKPATSLRMADAAHWIEACEVGTGLPKGTLVKCLDDAMQDAMADRVMGQPLALHLLRRRGGSALRGLDEGAA